MTGGLSARLPEFPWDRLAPYAEKAAAHPDGLVDLSVGAPVDPTPDVVQRALAAATDAPKYPLTYGESAVRDAFSGWLSRRFGVQVDPAAVLPTIGSKELVALMPMLLAYGPGDTVVVPALAYPTYEVGARLVGADVVATDSLSSLGPRRVSLIWVNSPANPHVKVLPPEHLRKVVEWARERGAIVASDECYLEYGWEEEPVSILDERVNGGSVDGLLAVHSLSKRSNIAGYRAGFVCGDASLVHELLEVRKNLGLIVPQPIQRAMVAALNDDAHVDEQRARYGGRRSMLTEAFADAGWHVEDGAGGLYLWVRRGGDDCWALVSTLADVGILVAPGEFYGPAGSSHARVAITATDERIAAAAHRLRAMVSS